MEKLCECGCGNPAPIATKTNKKRDRIKGQPMRFIYGHNRRKSTSPRFCLYCGKEIERTLISGKREEDRHSYIERKFCDSKCASDYRSGPRNSNWKGGKRIDKNGYIYLLVGRDHHLADSYGYALKHRIVAEKHFGRRLKDGEVVHHINGNRHDNSPDNLQIIKNAEHLTMHRALKQKRPDVG